ncbi:hypothetical protein Acsp04_32340 [Actinomadura sp. NBRC 104425]|uniref:hypothetical protein n=1 Tax=Actinomadura sp. NBRC 104425 TaxID=3032204 RepID=UPI0024A4F121|nr:hypothetical protein [Actinomadura sp. NBRC 104425]GLZ12999.1 hypothetical protein Acsp04_32340 [Actinomadura sp. NBRC 104425]
MPLTAAAEPHPPTDLPRAVRRRNPALETDAEKAAAPGLVTFACDGIDLKDEVRIALEERAPLSPGAPTGTEADHRFVHLT